MLQSKNNFTNVLFEAYKCLICNQFSGQIIKCKNCDAIFCKNCPFAHNNKSWAIISYYEQRCIQCFNPFFNETELEQIMKYDEYKYLLFVDKFDNYLLDSKKIEKL